jgi:hypothetical protein
MKGGKCIREVQKQNMENVALISIELISHSTLTIRYLNALRSVSIVLTTTHALCTTYIKLQINNTKKLFNK